jgi:hypothetical protein
MFEANVLEQLYSLADLSFRKVCISGVVGLFNFLNRGWGLDREVERVLSGIELFPRCGFLFITIPFLQHPQPLYLARQLVAMSAGRILFHQITWGPLNICSLLL